MNTIYMGYDHREKLAYQVAEYSIMKRTKHPENIQIIPLTLDSVKNILIRPIESKLNENGREQLWCPISNAPMTTEFAISRFCVPFIQRKGWALFMDCDMVCLADIEELFALADDKYAVMCVKHKHEPTEKYHDAGRLQTFYKRKNWSSVVLWNCSHESNKKLSIVDINARPGRDLHAFFWLDDSEIGGLPLEWNFLVGVNTGELESQKMLHYTNGSPAWGKDWEPLETDYVFNNEVKEMGVTVVCTDANIVSVSNIT